MAYSREVVARARARLEEARTAWEMENQLRLDKIYEAHPRLRVIDRELRVTMAEVARETFRGGEDRPNRIAAIRARNTALQQERLELLEKAGLDEEELEEKPICLACDGKGYIGSRMCQCLRELCCQEQKKELTSLLGDCQESFDNFRLDYYPDTFDSKLGCVPRDMMKGALLACRRYALEFGPHSGNLLLSGGTGLGKTMLSSCIARVVVDSGHSVSYVSAPHLVQTLEEAQFRGEPGEFRRLLEQYTSCDLLIIDDLGTEMTNQFTISALYTLINDRLMGNLPSIVSTNLNTEDLAKRYSPQIASRLKGSFRRVPFAGTDVRLLKSKA